MSLIIKKNICLLVFLLSSFSLCFCSEKSRYRYSSTSFQFETGGSGEEEEITITIKYFKKPKPVSWAESFVLFLNSPEIKKFLSNVVIEIYDNSLTDPELEKLKKEGKELRIIKKKFQKDLQGQKDMLQKSPQFFEEINKLQLRLKEE